MSSTLERKVFFYRTNVIPDDDGEVRDFSPSRSCAAVTRLRFLNHAGEQSRYMAGNDDSCFCVWPKIGTGRPKLCLGRCRHSGLPKLEELGEVSALGITAIQKLLEQIHVVFFEDGIVGAEFNFYGPRLNTLAAYLHDKTPTAPQVRFDPLLNHDARRLLTHMRDVRLLRLRLRRSDDEAMRIAEDHLPGALMVASEQIGAPVIEVILRSEPRSRRPLGYRVMDLLKELVGMKNAPESIGTLQARGVDDRTGKVEMFDFLADKFVYVRRVTKEEGRQRAVDSADMFNQIETAYNEHEAELREAAGVEL